MRSQLRLPEDRGPLRVMFLITSMPVGGAETLLADLIRRLDRSRFNPELCCLKEPGPLGEVLASEVPTHSNLTTGKFDLRVLPRLVRLLRQRHTDAVITVGAGDKMFWGRLAARWAGVPVVISALHSTGWPDGIGRLNRLLTPITDAFVGVAEAHGRHLVEQERFPREKVRVIPNGVDVERFRPRPECAALRQQLGLPPGTPVVGIVAALRPEKNHELFLASAALVLDKVPEARFLIVGDGPQRDHLKSLARDYGIASSVHFLGTRSDVPAVVSLLDVFALTSHVEANPVSILEAMAAGKPVVATRVGSVAESVAEGKTGYLVAPGNAHENAERLIELLTSPQRAAQMGMAGREQVVARGSVAAMVAGYEDLIWTIYRSKCSQTRPSARGYSPPHKGDTMERLAR